MLIIPQIQFEDWFVMTDLKKTHSPLPSHRKFLRFAVGGNAHQYRFFLSRDLSPCTFTKCMDAVLAPLRLQGDTHICVLNYLED